MDIKRIHDMIETLTEVAKCELDMGIEKVDTEEMGKVTDMIKDLAEAEYYAKISKAMDEAEYGEDYDYMGAYDWTRKGYKGQPRDSRGRYMPKGMRRKGYKEILMPTEDYADMDELMRDMDMPMGKMYYKGSMIDWQPKDAKEGRSGQSRKGYMETKEMNKGNSPEEKKAKMTELEKYMAELSSDVTEMIADASQEEKNLLKSKMQILMQKI